MPLDHGPHKYRILFGVRRWGRGVLASPQQELPGPTSCPSLVWPRLGFLPHTRAWRWRPGPSGLALTPASAFPFPYDFTELLFGVGSRLSIWRLQGSFPNPRWSWTLSCRARLRESESISTPSSQDSLEGEAAAVFSQDPKTDEQTDRTWEVAMDLNCPGPGLNGSASAVSGHLGLLQARLVCIGSKPLPGTHWTPINHPILIQGIGWGLKHSVVRPPLTHAKGPHPAERKGAWKHLEEFGLMLVAPAEDALRCCLTTSSRSPASPPSGLGRLCRPKDRPLMISGDWRI